MHQKDRTLASAIDALTVPIWQPPDLYSRKHVLNATARGFVAQSVLEKEVQQGTRSTACEAKTTFHCLAQVSVACYRRCTCSGSQTVPVMRTQSQPPFRQM